MTAFSLKFPAQSQIRRVFQLCTQALPITSHPGQPRLQKTVLMPGQEGERMPIFKAFSAGPNLGLCENFKRNESVKEIVQWIGETFDQTGIGRRRRETFG